MSKYNELVKKLKEIFQIDRPELDFGIYRILNAKSDEINDYLENTLKKKISDALATAGNANKEELEKQLVIQNRHKSLLDVGMQLIGNEYINYNYPEYSSFPTINLETLSDEDFDSHIAILKNLYNLEEFKRLGEEKRIADEKAHAEEEARLAEEQRLVDEAEKLAQKEKEEAEQAQREL